MSKFHDVSVSLDVISCIFLEINLHGLPPIALLQNTFKFVMVNSPHLLQDSNIILNSPDPIVQKIKIQLQDGLIFS